MHDFFNVTKGIIYVDNSDINDMESFKEGLNMEYEVEEIVAATWMKPRNPIAKPFLISFKSDTLPNNIHIPGEYRQTKVYPYSERPMQCFNCQKYGHVAKRCRTAYSICGKYGENHDTKTCTSESVCCYLCKGALTTTSRECPVRQKEEKIMEVQKIMKVGRRAAETHMENEYSNDEQNQKTY